MNKFTEKLEESNKKVSIKRNLRGEAFQLSTDKLQELITNGNDDKLAWECFKLKKTGDKFTNFKGDFKPLFTRTYGEK